MQQTLQALRPPQPSRGILNSGKPPLLVISTLVLIVGLATATVLATRTAEYFTTAARPDLVAVATEFLPGKPVDIRKLEAGGFICHDINQPIPADTGVRCSQDVRTGPIWRITVIIWDGTSQWLDLSFREYSLVVGDLAFAWGRPVVAIKGKWVVMRWPAQRATASDESANGRFSYFQSLSQLSFAL